MGYLDSARPGKGDYYAGDYYAGAPFLGFLGKAIGGALGGAFGGLFGGAKSRAENVPQPVGVMASGGGTIGASASGVNPGSISNTLGGRVAGWMQQHPGLTALAGGVLGSSAMLIPKLIGAGGMPMGPVAGGAFGVGQRRLHPNKSTYVVRGGGTSHYPVGMSLVVKGTSLVPTRRMNVANGRALRRALRRVAGFGKTVKRSRRAVSMAASALGVHHRGKKAIRRK